MRHVLLPLAALLLGACGVFDDETRLEGDRVPVRAATDAEPSAPAAALPAPREVAEWTHTNAVPSHNGGHVAAPASLSRLWRSDIGAGGGRLTGPPVVSGGAVFALDGESRVSRLDAGSGARAWRVSLAPDGEDGADGFGGGLAAEGGRIFAATGFGEVLAIAGDSGEILWRRRFGAPFRAAPSVSQGVVVAVGRDNQAYGLDARSGQPLWRLQGAAADAGVLGGASPAIAGGGVVLPFASGELVAATLRQGRAVWTAILGGGRRGLARSAISDVTGDPVILGRLVVAANQSGRIAAIDSQTGQRFWTRTLGSTGPIWAAGETLFVMGDDAKLRRLSARNGGTVWSVELPAFTDPADRQGVIAYSGPVLAGGRVLVTDDRGTLRAFDAETGEQAATQSIGAGSTLGAVVAGGIVYVLDEDGTLHAFR